MNTRNDKKGRIVWDTTLNAETFFASGIKGHEIRANGDGGALPRGYYGKAAFTSYDARVGTVETGLLGPFSCRKTAMRVTSMEVQSIVAERRENAA